MPIVVALIGLFASITTLIWKTCDRTAAETERRESARLDAANRDYKMRHEIYARAIAACETRSLNFSNFRRNPGHQGLADEQHRLGVAESEAVNAAIVICSEPVRRALNTFVNHYRSQPHRQDENADGEWWGQVVVARHDLEDAVRRELAEIPRTSNRLRKNAGGERISEVLMCARGGIRVESRSRLDPLDPRDGRRSGAMHACLRRT